MIYTKEETISLLDIFQLYFDKEDLRLRDIMMRDGTDGTGRPKVVPRSSGRNKVTCKTHYKNSEKQKNE